MSGVFEVSELTILWDKKREEVASSPHFRGIRRGEVPSSST